jgi:hypothetical protein
MLLVLTAERSPWNNNKLSPSWTETINTLTSTTTIIILFNVCFLESSLLYLFYFYVSNHRNFEIITFFYCSSHETRCKQRFFSFPPFYFVPTFITPSFLRPLSFHLVIFKFYCKDFKLKLAEERHVKLKSNFALNWKFLDPSHDVKYNWKCN